MELNVRQSYHGSGSGVTGVRGELETHLVVGTVQSRPHYFLCVESGETGEPLANYNSIIVSVQMYCSSDNR